MVKRVLLGTLLLALILSTGCSWLGKPGGQETSLTASSLPEASLAETSPSETISFSTYDFSNVRTISVRSMHSGINITLEDEVSVESIISFLSTIKGKARMSSKGYYGGTYEVILDFFDGMQFCIGFGDDESFNHGSHEIDTTYPNRYSLDGIMIKDVKDFFGQYLDLF